MTNEFVSHGETIPIFPRRDEDPKSFDEKIKDIKDILKKGKSPENTVVFTEQSGKNIEIITEKGDKNIEFHDESLSNNEKLPRPDSPKDYAEGDVNTYVYDPDENSEYRGGSYGELKEAGFGWPKHEIHHMPAASASELPREDGPAIVMDYEDHRQTASCGNSREAVEYRKKQADLIADGKFMEALQMDIDDIREKFGDKYNIAIKEALEYAKTVAKKLKEDNHA